MATLTALVAVENFLRLIDIEMPGSGLAERAEVKAILAVFEFEAPALTVQIFFDRHESVSPQVPEIGFHTYTATVNDKMIFEDYRPLMELDGMAPHMTRFTPERELHPGTSPGWVARADLRSLMVNRRDLSPAVHHNVLKMEAIKSAIGTFHRRLHSYLTVSSVPILINAFYVFEDPG
jgi:hypothetical protein